MKENVRFYTCPVCGNIIGLIEGNMEHINCCGRPMEKMIPNTVEASVEKHMPIYEKVEDELVVRVGKVEHPMEKDHYIMWIALVTDNKTIRVKLYPEQATETRFPYIKGAEIYAYCNKHGLWKTVIK